MYEKDKIEKEDNDEKNNEKIIQKNEISKINPSKNIKNNNLNEKQKNKFETMNNSKIEIEEFSSNILKIKKNNYYYLLDRNKYDINTIMMLLDLKRIYAIKEIFHEHKQGIEKNIFIKELKKKIPVDIIDTPNLVYGLYKFFCEIDFNGDQHMQWEEFTQFIIDTVGGDSQAKNINEDERKKIYNEKDMVKYKKYKVNKKMKDSQLYKNEINSIIFIPRFNYIAINQYGTRILKLYNYNTGLYEKSLDIEDFVNPAQNQNKFTAKKKPNSFVDVPEKQKDKNASYRVLCVTRFHSLIAICLSDKRIIFLNCELEHIELLYEMALPILEKRIWYLKNHNIWVTSGIKMPKFNFFTLNELDIEFQYNQQKYELFYNEGHPYRNHYVTTSSPHLSEIMDCIEITNPLLVLTACLDGKIRLINIETKKIIKIWSYHNFGVRQLNYNPYLDGGYISSVGFEYYINLYNLEYSLEDVYKGKLQGSFSPIISCQFILQSYMAVSVDEEGNIRIWNIRNKTCVQYIPQMIKKCKINNLLMIPKYNKFIIYGNRIVHYESEYKSKKNKVEKEDNYPIKVLYNYYYQQFYIATFRDIRIYSNKGQLIKIFQKLIPENFDFDVKIKNFIFENNYRKIYVGFSNGAILQFNAGNGALIKNVNEDNNMKEKTQKVNEFFHNKDITGLYFYSRPNDENLLISTSLDSLINISYEKNPEKSELLKTIKGSHSTNQKNFEILCIDFSETFNIFATGGSDGYIVVWDFEMTKVINIFTSNFDISYKMIVTFVKFLDPFPILAASFSDGTLYLLEINKIDKIPIKCLLRARNYYQTNSKCYLCNITFMNISYGKFPPFKKQEKASNANKKENESKDNNDQDNNNEKNNKIIQEVFKDEIIDEDIDKESENEDETKLKYYLFFGNENGYIKIINLLPFFKKNNIKPSIKEEIKSSLNLYKKEEINVSETIKYLSRKNQGSEKFPNFYNIYHNMVIYEKKIHDAAITNIEIIKEPLSFVSLSKDNILRIHNFEGVPIGKIIILPNLTRIEDDKIDWGFNINEKELMEKEIKQIVDIFENVGVEPILIGSELDEEMKKIQIKEAEKEKKVKEEKNEVKKIIIKKIYTKKRYKPLVKVKEEKIKEEKDEDSYKENEYIVAEKYFVQNSKNQIEKEIYGTNDNNGIVQITNQLIDMTMKKDRKKKEILEQKNEVNFTSFSNDKIKKIKKYSFNDIKKIKQQNEKKIEKEKIKIFDRSKFNTNTELVQLNKSKIKDEIFIDKNITSIYDSLTPRNTQNTEFTLLSPQMSQKSNNIWKQMIKSEKPIKAEYKKIKKLEIKKDTRYNTKVPILKLSKIRNGLLTTRLFKRDFKKIELDKSTNSRCLSYEKTMNKFNSKVLPNLYNKIIFKKGETERFINYQFYNSAYKACCETSKNEAINNISIKTNYKNNWKLVTKYLKNKKDKKK